MAQEGDKLKNPALLHGCKYVCFVDVAAAAVVVAAEIRETL